MSHHPAPSARLGHSLLLATALLWALPAWAASSASSAASDSASTSVGSLSTSVENSSKSSSKGKETAAGQYTVIDMAEAPAREGLGAMTRLRLQAVPGKGAEGEFFLTVPTVAVQQGGVETGQLVAANTRPYGLEFTRVQTQRPFFLAMTDEWMRELRTSAVTL
jgi:hypothetical protein